jgi:hypothetical protein
MEPSRTDAPLAFKLALVLGLLFGALACAQLGRPEVHEWWHERGPVIPHDTFPADCTLCHLGDDWTRLREDFRFDHAAETGVALEGAHADAECLRCHNDRGPVAVFAARGCAGCHEDVHRTQLGQACDRCHVETSWRPIEEIAIHARVGFPLEGAHLTPQCWQCHDGADQGVFSGAPRECDLCHQADLERALAPDHQAQGWTSDCERCHVPLSWSGAGFTHSQFPLLGAHAAADCDGCHGGGVFAGTPSQCVDCHLGDYQGASDPDHLAAGFGTDCESCHVPFSWEQATLDHSAWRLSGAHAAADCSSCHGGGVFAGLPSECVDCHQADYDGTTDPGHAAAGFPTDCAQCHGTTSWLGAQFGHESWRLTGMHAAASCDACHGGGVYAGLPSECVDCHLTDYNGTTAPDHAASGFPTSCDQCHTTTAWTRSSFNHDSWRLTGAHTLADCADCHGGGVYAGLPSDCVDCHLSEYRGTTDPNHAAAGFPTSCATCHSTTTWFGASFQHDFPINGGDHGGLDCTECHQNPRSFAVFSCTHCHAHSQGEMADEHDRVPGYVWSSPACYSCHPDGND